MISPLIVATQNLGLQLSPQEIMEAHDTCVAVANGTGFRLEEIQRSWARARSVMDHLPPASFWMLVEQATHLELSPDLYFETFISYKKSQNANAT